MRWSLIRNLERLDLWNITRTCHESMDNEGIYVLR